MSERLLDHHTPPAHLLAVLALLSETRAAEILYDYGKEPIRNREVKKNVLSRLVLARYLLQLLAEPLVQVRVGQVAPEIRQAARKPVPYLLIERVQIVFALTIADEAFQHIDQRIAPVLDGAVRNINTDDRQLLGQQFRARQIVECREQQALRQIAAGAKNH